MIEPNEDSRSLIKNEYGTKAYADLNSFVSQNDMKNIDGFWLASPTKTHLSWIQSLAKFQKPIYTEKPLTTSIEDTKKVIQICEENKLPLHTAWQRRSEKYVHDMLKNIKEKNWTHIKFFDRDNPIPPQDILVGVGDFIADFACHPINLSLLMTQDLTPYKVNAVGTRSYKTNLVDHLELVMVYKDPVTKQDKTVTIDTSRKNPENHFDVTMEIQTDSEILNYGKWTGDVMPNSWMDRHEEAYRSEMEYFYKVLTTNDPYNNVPQINPSTDDIRTTKLVAALQKSLYTKRVVYLDENVDIVPYDSKVKLSFLGCGNFGGWYKNIIVDSEQVMSQFDIKDVITLDSIDESKGEKMGDLFKQKILENDNVDAVYISTPDHNHHTEAIACMQAGKDVFVEKPVFEFGKVLNQA